MAATLKATSGAADSNSYVTLVEADEYVDTRLNAGLWDAADPNVRIRALIEATRELDTLGWLGSRTDDTQLLSWPRESVPDPDSTLADPSQDYPYYTKTVIPKRIKDAQIEIALEFVKAGTTDLAVASNTVGVVSKTTGPLTTQWASSSARPQGLYRWPRVLRLITPLLDGAGELVRT